MFSMDLGSGECDGYAVVALRGELDLTDAAAVAAALEVFAVRESRIIADLTGLDFIDASGVAALLRGRKHARNAGGDLLLAAPQRQVRRILAIISEAGDSAFSSSVAEAAASAGDSRPAIALIRPRPTKMRWPRVAMSVRPGSGVRLPEAGSLAALGRHAAGRDGRMDQRASRPLRGEDGDVAADRTARVWAWIAAAREGGAPVSLAALCRAAAGSLGVDGASVTALGGPAVREPLAATDALSAGLEELLLTTGEGPGADDLMFGSPMLIPDLELVAERWPGFAPAAIAAGARALFAFPLQAGAIRSGVLSLYRAQPVPLTPQQLADALVFADIARQLLLDSAAGIIGAADYQPLNGLSDSRAEVYQATGMISVQLGVSLEDAFVRLRAHAFAASTPLDDVADEVVSRTLRFDPDPHAGSRI